jgi:hypothetical protein
MILLYSNPTFVANTHLEECGLLHKAGLGYRRNSKKLLFEAANILPVVENKHLKIK